MNAPCDRRYSFVHEFGNVICVANCGVGDDFPDGFFDSSFSGPVESSFKRVEPDLGVFLVVSFLVHDEFSDASLSLAACRVALELVFVHVDAEAWVFVVMPDAFLESVFEGEAKFSRDFSEREGVCGFGRFSRVFVEYLLDFFVGDESDFGVVFDDVFFLGVWVGASWADDLAAFSLEVHFDVVVVDLVAFWCVGVIVGVDFVAAGSDGECFWECVEVGFDGFFAVVVDDEEFVFSSA